MARRRKPASVRAAAPAARRPSPAANWAIAFGVMLVTWLVFRTSLAGEFLAWDDDHNFLTNTAYRGLDASHLRWMFTTFFLGPYQPLSWVTLGLDFVVWGMNPYGYHLTNLLLHVLNAGLMYFVAVRFLAIGAGSDVAKGRAAGLGLASAAAALFFAIHPLRVEPVAWVTERREVLAGAFTLMTVLAYLKAGARGSGNARSRRWYVAAIVAFALSLLSKASAMTLPAVLFLLDWWRVQRTPRAAGEPPSHVPWRALIVRQIPFAALGLVALVLAGIGQRIGEMTPRGAWEPWIVRLPRLFHAPMFYLSKLVAPAHLSNLYEVPFRSNPADWHFIASAVGVLLITVAAFRWRARWPGLIAAWLSYLVLIAPVSGAMHPGGQILADRFTYLSCLVFALLAAGGLLEIRRAAGTGKLPASIVPAAMAVTVAALVVFGTLTIRRIPVWHDSIALWEDALAAHPAERAGSPAAALGQPAYRIITLGLGTALRTAGRSVEAIPILGKGAAASPGDGDIRNSWAAALMDVGRMDEASTVLDEAVRLDPTHAEAALNLGIARAAQGRVDDALAAYGRAVELDPRNAVAFYNMGVLLADSSRLDEAVARYRQAIAIRPEYSEAFNNLGVALGRLGRTAEAAAAFERAVGLDPSNMSARQNHARAIEALRRGR